MPNWAFLLPIQSIHCDVAIKDLTSVDGETTHLSDAAETPHSERGVLFEPAN